MTVHEKFVLLASIKHGGEDVNSEPKFGRYKPGIKK